MNPSTALAVALADELIRCGLTDAVLAPGSRSAPLAMELHRRAERGELRLHVRIDERSAAYLAMGLGKASGRPAAVLCTSGTAAASFHPAVVEASESCLPLLVLTADRPPELRGTGANQAIDQIKLYGDSVRWFCEVGVPEDRAGQVGYWRSLACRAWGLASGRQVSGAAGAAAGPVHLNLAFRDPLVPDGPVAGEPGPSENGTGPDWPEPLDGRPGGAPWVRFAATSGPAGLAAGVLELPWAERGLIVCGDGHGDVDPLLALAAAAGWPVLAEPSSGARRGPDALAGYEYLIGSPAFLAGHRPDVIVSAGRPGLSRPQTALLRGVAGSGRHVVIAAQPGHWDDPARTATDVAAAIQLTGGPGSPAGPAGPDTAWRQAWRGADAAARAAVDAILGTGPALSEPRLARDLAAALPDGALLWAASSMPIRDLDQHMAPRPGIRVLASRGASGIDGTTSAAIGAALAHQAAGGGPAYALIGDLALLHDAPGLFIGPGEPRPDLCLIVVNNDGGGIFSTLEQASHPASFERVFGTPHGADLGQLAAAAGCSYQRVEHPGDLAAALAGSGLRMVEVRTSREAGAALRNRLRDAATAAISRTRAAAPAD
ncbi:MAG TPA: 2-succinyl-5-enolpyruvyl-6-hydroxy-3-cyclohexene-1-carboxylic-acid synthase [Streptosporangiaceae bacterium]|nr:2-succinyl-5-enolpyruvyl-6-hydroxy-3-cyclohexene-1-carboxylic-acid synthase [Streptosporangiaceae bacterium]